MESKNPWKIQKKKMGKIHLGVCPDTKQILISKLAESNESDVNTTLEIIDEVQFQIDKVYGDGIYDAARIYEKLWEKGAKTVIPIKKNVRYISPDKPWLRYRDEQLFAVFKMRGDDIARAL